MQRVDAERLERGEPSPLCVVRKLKRRGLKALQTLRATAECGCV